MRKSNQGLYAVTRNNEEVFRTHNETLAYESLAITSLQGGKAELGVLTTETDLLGREKQVFKKLCSVTRSKAQNYKNN